MKKRGSLVLAVSVVGLLMLVPLSKAYALASFTRQTGMDCSVCHTVFPELTPIGRDFKLNGYVLSVETPKWFIPLSARLLASYTGARGLTNGVAPFDSAKNDATARAQLPQQFNMYWGGKIWDQIGGMVQVSYFGNTNSLIWDNSDFRYANSTTLAGKNLTFGLTLNNNPTQQDLWHSTPAWGFPFNSSNVALTPTASPIIGALSTQVAGLGVYASWNDLIYLEGSVYRTTDRGITRPFGAGSTISKVVSGPAPYWRLVLQHGWGDHYLSLGTYGINADIFPSGEERGPTDRFTDLALDAQYQYITEKHTVSLATSYIHEDQKFKASFPLGSTANPSNRLNTFRANVNYYYRPALSFLDAIGGTVAYFSTSGTADPVLYAPAQFTGSGNGKPNSSGFILEADYLPWRWAKFGVQYTLYTKFNGNGTNYDGFGTNAWRNNTIYFFAELAF